MSYINPINSTIKKAQEMTYEDVYIPKIFLSTQDTSKEKENKNKKKL